MLRLGLETGPQIRFQTSRSADGMRVYAGLMNSSIQGDSLPGDVIFLGFIIRQLSALQLLLH